MCHPETSRIRFAKVGGARGYALKNSSIKLHGLEFGMKFVKYIALLGSLGAGTLAYGSDKDDLRFSVGVGDRWNGLGVAADYALDEKLGIFASVGRPRAPVVSAGVDYFLTDRHQAFAYKITAAYGYVEGVTCDETCTHDQQVRFGGDYFGARLGVSLIHRNWEYGFYWTDISEYASARDEAMREGLRYPDVSQFHIGIGYLF